MNRIQELAKNNGPWPDTLHIKEYGDLILLNYRPEVQFDNLWTDIELVCRGLIINRKTGEVVARPFDKIFNWGENNRTTNSNIKNITEKLDGSLGILYRNPGYKIATRGSFESEQALWATDFFYKKYGDTISHFPNSWTLLFEIIYPENRIVVDYGERRELVLLAIRDRFTGEYLSNVVVGDFAQRHGFGFPKTYSFKSIPEIIEACSVISANNEGWVVEFEDGQRFKFKGDEYKKIHKLISGLSFKFVLENHQAGTLKQALDLIPDEFKDEVNDWIDQIETKISYIKGAVEDAFKSAPKESRKDYALWVQKHVKDLAPCMFARLDGKDILPIIYKVGFNAKQG